MSILVPERCLYGRQFKCSGEHLCVRDPSRLLGLCPRAAFGLYPWRGRSGAKQGSSWEWYGDVARLAEHVLHAGQDTPEVPVHIRELHALAIFRETSF